MLPTGFFAEVPGGAESERAGVARILDGIRSASRDTAQHACVSVQRAHAEVLIEYLTARGVFTNDDAD
jgi:hypothetical protein